MKYGLIGEKLGHSFSKEIHEKIENYDYRLQEIAREDLDDFMTKREFVAINVTIPYKEAVIPHLSSIDDKAKAIGAVNTIVNSNGKLHGYNTDFLGMEALIKKAGIEPEGKKVIILGSGGTAKTAFAVAKYMGASDVICTSRTGRGECITYEELYENHSDVDIIINTTPCGMFPNCGDVPVEIDRFPKLSGVIDAIYNPLRTNLVLSALKKGIKAEGGLYMLASQAVFAAEKFTGKTYDLSVTDKAYNDIFSSKENIVLIGMPASGKTTVGKIISKITSREIIDTDAMIVEKAQMEITDIFEKYGEKYFRDLESECVEEASAKNGCIIATGGGAILRKENVDSLSRNGKIYFIDRPLSSLIPTSDRPLASDEEAIRKRYTERYCIYCDSANEIIDADCSADEVAKKILKQHYLQTEVQ
ncbi:MAG: shikimate dehydrogenase [Clostridia bacterium]|nr:shikimate dehydrogenase [Clostridia bacterium]